MCYASQIDERHTYNYIHMKNIRCLNLLDGYILMVRAKGKKHDNGTRTERQIHIYIYIFTMKQQTKKKQENVKNKRQTL